MNKTIVRREGQDHSFSNEIHPLLQRIYSARGILSDQELERGLEQLLPFQLLSNIENAVDCLFHAITKDHHIMIIGDFDADGATSTALAVTALKSFGAKKISYLVPNRFEYGYGLTPEIVDVAAEAFPDLLVTVDNGISSYEGVERAKEKNIKVVITDHHLPGTTLPSADAIVNPNLPGDEFPSKHLAGVGVIFYVMLALRAKMREQNWFSEQGITETNMATLLDLVALGTVADVVVLDKNNRVLVHQGLLRIRSGKFRIGIKALLDVANRQYPNLNTQDLGFVIAPRLNAAGRLVDMRLGIECLLSDDYVTALKYAKELDALNKERQLLESEMREQAIEDLANLPLVKSDLPVGLCLFNEKWHQGVIGILASRLKEFLHRPVFAFAINKDDELKGSGRSITGIHLRDTLESIVVGHPELNIKFGGHAMAAGMSIQRKHFEKFAKLFDEYVSLRLTREQLQGIIHSDGELSPNALTLEIAELLKNAGPWGQGFPEPLFDGQFKILSKRLLKDKHLKFTLSLRETSRIIDAIAFNVSKEQAQQECAMIHAAYRLDINEFRGERNVQLLIEHFEFIE